MANQRRINFPPFALDLVNECLWHGSRTIRLRPKAFAVLEHLVARPGELVTKEHLIGAVWHDTFVGDAVLKVAIRQIREALSDDPRSPRFIETAHRRGYRFIGTIGPHEAPAIAQAPVVSTAPITPRARELPAGFVGREAALARLHGWLEGARRGECQIVFVTGEAGIGKTTLLDAFAASSGPASAVRICSGQCLEQYGMSEAYLPVLDAIRQLCREDPQATDVLRAHAPMWLMQMPSLVTPADRDTFGRDAAAATRERMLREMGDALDALTASSVLLLVLEDLHWSDVSTVDLISYVARRRRAAHLMVVGTYRPAELIAGRHPLKRVKQDLAARQQCEELPLGYLTRQAVEQHLAVRFPAHRFPEDLVTLIHERTDGNPLFMVNTIDYLVDEGLIEAHAEGWRLAAPIDTVKLGVPDSIRQLIDTQVDRLDARDQRMLEAASVAGTEFSAAAVSAALECGLADVEVRCEELSRRRYFLEDRGIQLLPDGQAVGRFAFVHAVFRHVLYERLSAARRAQLHRRVGQRGEDSYGERAAEIAAELAMHFEQAGDHERAVRYLRQAAINALRRSAYREAIALSRRGLDLLATLPDDTDRARQELWLRITLGVPLIAVEGYAAPEVGSVYHRARVLCERLESPPELAQVLWGLWTYHMLRAELATALDLAGDCLRLAERAPHPGAAMRGHWAMEITTTHQGNFSLALDHFAAGLPLYDVMQGPDDAFVDAINPGVAMRCFAAWCLWFTGHPDRALAGIEEAVALARAASEPHGLAHALLFAAIVHQLRRDRARTREHAETALTLAAEHGLVFYGAMARVVRGWTLLGRGRDDHAASQMRQGIAAWQGTGAQLLRPHFLALLSEAHAADRRRALRILDDALAVAAATDERCYEAEILRLRGEYLAARVSGRADTAAARACFEQALDVARRQQALSLELRAAMSLARLDLGAAPHAAARETLRRVYDRFDEGFDTPDLRDARGLLGLSSAR